MANVIAVAGLLLSAGYLWGGLAAVFTGCTLYVVAMFVDTVLYRVKSGGK